jgi:hypothetical protein
MERERVRPLHDRLASAIERAARVHGESSALIEDQQALAAEVQQTLAVIDRRRIAERDAAQASGPAFGNGQRDAGAR